MVKASEQKIYCAIDIEATGFDPLTEEILEIGFVFFRHAKNSFEILEEWSQIFKPSKAVSSKILGLTGIAESEIESAPALSEFHDFVQEKLRDAILVGHSVGVDVRYLEANGFNLSGQYIDTLELVQFILPTRHSYNLENLMHYFAIAHENAHRALEDARASMLLLQKLLGLFKSFPKEVQERVGKITGTFSFVWHPLLSEEFAPVKMEPEQSAESADYTLNSFTLEANKILDFKIGTACAENILTTIKKEDKQFFFGVPNKNQLLVLWQQGFGKAVFSPEDTFDVKKFEDLLTKTQSNPDLAKFLAKVVVWHGTNWQTTTILDLNLSFAGNQFRYLIAGGQSMLDNSEQVLLAEHKTLLSLAQRGQPIDRHLVIQGLPEFEDELTAGIGKKASWGNAIRILHSIYNPETNFGQSQLAKEVLDLLVATDLFFGLCSLTLERFFADRQQVKYEMLQNNSKAFRDIEQASKNYAQKLSVFAEIHKLEPLKIFVHSLLSFFDNTNERVKWIEFGPRFCIFNNLPLKVDALASSCLEIFNAATFADVLGQDLIYYFQKRLGLEDYQVVDYGSDQTLKKPTVSILKETFRSETVVKNLSEHLPLAIVMPTYKRIKELYDANFRELQEQAAIFAEGYSGGTNKMFYNFGLSAESILVLTTKLAIRSGRQGVGAKTLILDTWPQSAGPGVYTEAVKEYMSGQGVKTEELSKVAALNKVIRLFFSPRLEFILIYGDLNEEYLKMHLKTLGFSNFHI